MLVRRRWNRRLLGAFYTFGEYVRARRVSRDSYRSVEHRVAKAPTYKSINQRHLANLEHDA